MARSRSMKKSSPNVPEWQRWSATAWSVWRGMKDGLAQLLTGDTITKGIKVTGTDEGTTIEFHIIVEYGTNISTIADNLMSNVKYSVKEMLGIDVDDISVFVEGIRTEQA